MNGERTLNNSCSQSLAAKGTHKNFKVCFPNIPVQVEFYWDQTSVCWNISILHDRGTNHPKSRVHVHPSRFILYSSTVFVFASPLYLKGQPFTQDVIWKGWMLQVISSLLPVSNLILEKIRKKSQKIDLNRIIRQRIFRFLHIEIFGSIPTIFGLPPTPRSRGVFIKYREHLMDSQRRLFGRNTTPLN